MIAQFELWQYHYCYKTFNERITEIYIKNIKNMKLLQEIIYVHFYYFH